MAKTGLGEVMEDKVCISRNARRPIVHVRFLKLQKISVTLGETSLPFLPFSFLVERLEASPEGENHDDAQPIGHDTNTVRVSASLTPALGQMYEPATLPSQPNEL